MMPWLQGITVLTAKGAGRGERCLFSGDRNDAEQDASEAPSQNNTLKKADFGYHWLCSASLSLTAKVCRGGHTVSDIQTCVLNNEGLSGPVVGDGGATGSVLSSTVTRSQASHHTDLTSLLTCWDPLVWLCRRSFSCCQCYCVLCPWQTGRRSISIWKSHCLQLLVA